MKQEIDFEKKYDELLGIETRKKEYIGNDYQMYHRYEPTPYYALNELIKEIEITANDVIVDFGCGIGRVGFFLNYNTACAYVGLEMKLKYFKEALDAKESYLRKCKKQNGKIEILCYMAEAYVVHPRENIFYFFNPFSIEIFQKVIARIMDSLELAPRKITFVLYYPSKEYITYLIQIGAVFAKEINLEPYCQKDEREQFAIFTFGQQLI